MKTKVQLCIAKTLTCNGELKGLCMLISVEKLKFRGTLAPRKGRNL